MKVIDPKNSQVAFACWGIHVGLTGLLAMSLAAYDGLEHTYKILMCYMFLGWIIPFAGFKYIRVLMGSPVSTKRATTNRYVIPAVLVTLGALFVLLSIILPQSVIRHIRVNGQVVGIHDPRFALELRKARLSLGCLGLLVSTVGGLSFCFIRKCERASDKDIA